MNLSCQLSVLTGLVWPVGTASAVVMSVPCSRARLMLVTFISDYKAVVKQLRSSCKCIKDSNHSVVAALQTVLTSPHLKSITENTGATRHRCLDIAVYDALSNAEIFVHACTNKLHAITQAQAVLRDTETCTSTWCALQMLMLRHRLPFI